MKNRLGDFSSFSIMFMLDVSQQSEGFFHDSFFVVETVNRKVCF